MRPEEDFHRELQGVRCVAMLFSRRDTLEHPGLHEATSRGRSHMMRARRKEESVAELPCPSRGGGDLDAQWPRRNCRHPFSVPVTPRHQALVRRASQRWKRRPHDDIGNEEPQRMTYNHTKKHVTRKISTYKPEKCDTHVEHSLSGYRTYKRSKMKIRYRRWHSEPEPAEAASAFTVR